LTGGAKFEWIFIENNKDLSDISPNALKEGPENLYIGNNPNLKQNTILALINNLEMG